MSAQPTRQRRNFQEFTKMATPAAEAQVAAVVGDSVIDLGAEAEEVTPALPAMQQDAAHLVTRSGLAPAGTAKATLEIPKATALPSGFDDAPSSVSAVEPSARLVAPTLMSTPTPVAPMVSAPLAAAAPYVAPVQHSVVAAKKTESSGNKKFVMMAAGLLLVGGGAFALTRGTAEVQAPVAPVAAVSAAPVAVAPVAAPVVAPVEVAPVVAAEPVKMPAKGAPVAAATPAPVAAAPVAAVKPASPTPAPVLGDLEGAISRAAGPVKSAGDVSVQSADERANVPQRPSQGAMTGALRPNISAASKCLGDDMGDSRATIVFESTGKAQSVSVSGPAAGTPAEACIVKALMKTKVGAFADATYSTPVTIRH